MELLCTLSTLLNLRRFDCANKQPKNCHLSKWSLHHDRCRCHYVEVSRAVFLKLGNIAILGAKSKRGRKRRRGAIAHEPCKTFYFCSSPHFPLRVGNSHSSVALYYNTSLLGRGGDDDMQSTVKGQWHKKV